jgi:DNA helicase-2/ATP-dependent DNA helicase PcrA
MNLNQEQHLAVESTAYRILVLAGPGSGKTMTLIARILKLIERGAKPDDIVCITYTRSAAAEIQKRLGELITVQTPPAEQPEPMRLGFAGTLHAFAFNMLSKHGTLIGLPPRLSVADDEQRESLVESIAAEMGIKIGVKNVIPLLARGDLIDGQPGHKSKAELVASVYHSTLKSAGLLDFDSMLFYFLKLLRTITIKIERPFEHLLVDEIQDSSDADMWIYHAMNCRTKFLVGDADQAIYSFRGGNVVNAMNVSHDPGWSTYTLQNNHRCKSVIANAAQVLIEHNAQRYPKITTAIDSGGSVVVERFDDPAGEMAFIANELSADHHSHAKVARNGNGTCAVLCRTNAIAKQIGTYLKSLGIGVAEKKEVVVPKDWRKAKLLLSVLANPNSDFVVHQFLIASEGRKRADIIKLKAAGQMKSINDTLNNPFEMTLDSAVLEEWKISMESRQRIRDASSSLSCIMGEWTIPELILFINSQEDVAKEIGDGVHVGTIHASKGREFSTVYLAGFEDEVIPGKKCGDDPSEERRLAFVGVTRAKQRLVITWCKGRPQNRGPKLEPGPMEPRTPSRFIAEMGLEP